MSAEFKPEDFSHAILSRLQCEHVALIANEHTKRLRESFQKACDALAMYGEHDDGCLRKNSFGKICSCGFEQVISELDAAMKG